MNKMSVIVAFAAGVAAGSLVMWRVYDAKIKEVGIRAEEAIAAIKEKYSGNKEDTKPEEPEEDDTSEADAEYKRILDECKYTSNDNLSPFLAPYIITPEEFGETGYEMVSWTYYKDGVMTDENGCVLDKEDIDDLIGLDAINHFGEHEADAVHIRNEEQENDYEILRVEVDYDTSVIKHA